MPQHNGPNSHKETYHRQQAGEARHRHDSLVLHAGGNAMIVVLGTSPFTGNIQFPPDAQNIPC